ncbi:hypothetical protein NE237_002129 [Protea cynaroides]|uniref:Uncharacterized protein n=1 Tax=Protea cynaroides TaxID=273540 RepID=A0A9Q0QYS5_9MAGN|nr:hypothetical protein NE237_002129 [Protea cynaroides]
MPPKLLYQQLSRQLITLPIMLSLGRTNLFTVDKQWIEVDEYKITTNVVSTFDLTCSHYGDVFSDCRFVCLLSHQYRISCPIFCFSEGPKLSYCGRQYSLLQSLFDSSDIISSDHLQPPATAIRFHRDSATVASSLRASFNPSSILPTWFSATTCKGDNDWLFSFPGVPSNGKDAAVEKLDMEASGVSETFGGDHPLAGSHAPSVMFDTSSGHEQAWIPKQFWALYQLSRIPQLQDRQVILFPTSSGSDRVRKKRSRVRPGPNPAWFSCCEHLFSAGSEYSFSNSNFADSIPPFVGLLPVTSAHLRAFSDCGQPASGQTESYAAGFDLLQSLHSPNRFNALGDLSSSQLVTPQFHTVQNGVMNR